MLAIPYVIVGTIITVLIVAFGAYVALIKQNAVLETRVNTLEAKCQKLEDKSGDTDEKLSSLDKALMHELHEIKLLIQKNTLHAKPN